MPVSDAGWVKLHRSIRDNELWNERPFDKARAWLDLIMSANWRPRKVFFQEELIAIERGSFVTSKLKLAKRWGWSRTKVDAYFNMLLLEQMLLIKSDNRKSIISIVNYDTYQDMGATDQATEDTTDHTTEDTTEKHNEELKNERKKELKNKDKAPEAPLIIPGLINSLAAQTAWADWLEHKKSLGKAYKSIKSQQMQLNRLSALLHTPERFIAAIQFSIGQNYQGIYEEKHNNGAPKGAIAPSGYSEAFEHNMRLLKEAQDEDEQTRSH